MSMGIQVGWIMSFGSGVSSQGEVSREGMSCPIGGTVATEGLLRVEYMTFGFSIISMEGDQLGGTESEAYSSPEDE